MADILRTRPVVADIVADIWPIKHSIVQLLSQHTERWSSPAEIKAEVADVPDRTLRRWLNELVQGGDVERSGSRKGTRYRWKPTVRERRLPAVATGADADR